MKYLLYVVFLPINFALLSKFMPHRKKFFWYEYFGLFALPLLVTAALTYASGMTAWVVFFIWCLIGPLLESFVGHTYLWLTNSHLWIYERAPLFRRTTSWLTIPFWGFGGVIFYAVNKIITTALK